MQMQTKQRGSGNRRSFCEKRKKTWTQRSKHWAQGRVIALKPGNDRTGALSLTQALPPRSRAFFLRARQYRMISQQPWRKLHPLPGASERTGETRAYFRSLAGLALSTVLVMGSAVQAQEAASSRQVSSAATPIYREQTQKNVAAPCLEPPPLVRWQDYQGKFEKLPERWLEDWSANLCMRPTTISRGSVCAHSNRKTNLFSLFTTRLTRLHSSMSRITRGWPGGKSDPTFGQGATGYGKRLGAGLATQASSEFFKDFAYPAIFSEDPRYYRLAGGGTGKRLCHAAAHVLIAHRENGTHMFNFSEWFGTSSAVALSNVYHPGNKRGFFPAAHGVGYSMLNDSGFDILREFWPEIARKLKLPFRGR